MKNYYTFVFMRGSHGILNYLMCATIIGVLLLHSLHSFCHFERIASIYKQSKSENNVSYFKYSDTDECAVCDFAFSDFMPCGFTISFAGVSQEISEQPQSESLIVTSFFKGALFSLRAPPSAV